jgi:hypothetical protein
VRDLLLDRIVHTPTEPVAQVVTQVDVHYREEMRTGFDTVTILPDGVRVKVQTAAWGPAHAAPRSPRWRLVVTHAGHRSTSPPGDLRSG